jgi:hypothetical protein
MQENDGSIMLSPYSFKQVCYSAPFTQAALDPGGAHGGIIGIMTSLAPMTHPFNVACLNFIVIKVSYSQNHQ